MILAIKNASRSSLKRAAATLRALHLRILIRAAENDAVHHDEMTRLSPVAADMARKHAQALRVQLVEAENDAARG